MAEENVVIALPDDTDRACTIISAGRRIARAAGLQWVALRIVGNSSEHRVAVDELAPLVTGLGGRLLCARARDIASGLLELSRREHARVLVIGRSCRPKILRRVRRGTTERILSAKRPFDVVVASEAMSR
jgi:K+-sensing histidine kinase KdpD